MQRFPGRPILPSGLHAAIRGTRRIDCDDLAAFAEDAGPELKRLRLEMAEAHPDRGGSAEAYMAARKRYD